MRPQSCTDNSVYLAPQAEMYCCLEGPGCCEIETLTPGALDAGAGLHSLPWSPAAAPSLRREMYVRC